MPLLAALIMLTFIATIASLGWGIGSMVHEPICARHSTQLMTARVIFQGLTIIFLLMVFFLAA